MAIYHIRDSAHIACGVFAAGYAGAWDSQSNVDAGTGTVAGTPMSFLAEVAHERRMGMPQVRAMLRAVGV